MLRDLKRMSFRHKNNKPVYYLKNYIRQIIPSGFYQRKIEKKVSLLSSFNQQVVFDRVNYYNQLERQTTLPDNAEKLSDFKLEGHIKTYYFDTYEYTRYFPDDLRITPLYGDITYVPEYPMLTKSRPIAGDNANSVLLKLDKIRHFLFVKDNNRFVDKKDMMIGRSKARQQHRIDFLNMYFDHPMCNIGQINRDMNPQFIANRMTLEEHLKYKFILCLEGHDVASNLKWVMSSNSLAVMPKPKYETWYMEGKLVANEHYVLIKDDYSDLEERLNYYIDHPNEALDIIEHAHQYTLQFQNKRLEDLISLLVLKKFFEKTGQL